MIMSAAALLQSNKQPSEADVRSALDGNLCRCGSHVRVLSAVMAATGQRG
jgi:aerobic-type carbon monoxide dehydrogenase small subunit (CoxS/CutS family)